MVLDCILCQSSISLVQGDTWSNALACHLAREHKATKEERKMNNEENKTKKEEKHLALLLAIHFLTEEEREMVMKMAESRMFRNKTRTSTRRSLVFSGESFLPKHPARAGATNTKGKLKKNKHVVETGV